MNYFQIAVDFPVYKSVLVYKSNREFTIGSMILVPLGKRKAKGVVLEMISEQDAQNDFELDKIKEIIELIEHSYIIDEKQIKLYKWMSQYYHYSLGKLIFDCVPKVMKRPLAFKFSQGKNLNFPYDLTNEQNDVFQKVKENLFSGFSRHYLHGVTGSGKSLVYLSLIKETLAQGKSAQFLIPEINLTPQFIKMFEDYVGVKVLSYHSGVSPSQKFNIWNELTNNEGPYLIMGVRSSIFLPTKDLGLIIVDEEHDYSFKQNDRCPYNGRDVAIKKAQIHGIPILLGSATPSCENFYNFAIKDKSRFYYQLPDRVGEGYFPKLKLIDMRDRFNEKDAHYPLLEETFEAIEEKLKANEQVLVFINKLGYSHFIQCRSCGHQFKNEKCGCDNNLRYFKSKNILSCAHCDYKAPLPETCPECGSLSLVNKGFGTEKVESVLKEKFKDFVIERFDRDEISTIKELNDKLERFNRHEIDIFVGTQMLAKGHNFEKVNLVVMLGVDNMLNFADFRSSEKMYQLTKQVAGRAGRYSPKSEVLIQTMNVNHTIYEFIAKNDLESFYKDEISLREICFCPPFSKMAMIYFNSRFRDKSIIESSKVVNSLNRIVEHEFNEVKLLGPSPSPIEKKANQYTWSLMLKSDNLTQLHLLLDTFVNNYQAPSSVSYKIDVDPI